MLKFQNLFFSLTVINVVLAVVFFNRASTNQTFGYKWLELEDNRKVLQNESQQITLDLSDSKALTNIYASADQGELNQFANKEFYLNLNDIAYVE